MDLLLLSSVSGMAYLFGNNGPEFLGEHTEKKKKRKKQEKNTLTRFSLFSKHLLMDFTITIHVLRIKSHSG